MNENKEELIKIMKKDFIYLAICYIITLLIFQGLFYKESFLVILRTISAFYWTIIIPGIFIVYSYNKNSEFLEKMFLGSAISLALNGLLNYYLGLAGLNIKYHWIILPVVIMGVCSIIALRKKKEPSNSS
jgi:hypothetical protein